jgi:hypothetical protein
MSINKFEQKALNEINLNEGIIGAIAKFFLGSKFRASMRELEKMKKDDPTLKADLASFYQNYKVLRNQLDTICAKRPDLPNCKDN